MKKVTALLLFVFSAFLTNAQTDYSFKINLSGEGEHPIILIPGYTCGGEVWTSTLETLNPHFACHTLTMAGFAGHTASTDPSIENWVKEIATYIQQEDLGKVTIIGHSLGGVMGQWLAADYPDLVERFIVVDALPCLAALNNAEFKANETPDCSQMKSMFDQMDEAQFEATQKMSLPMMTSDESKYEQILEWSVSSDRNTLAEIYCELMNTDLRDKISSVQCPSLILLETNFKWIEAAINQQYSKLEKSKLVYATKGMHFIMYDDPIWYMEQINEFLN